MRRSRTRLFFLVAGACLVAAGGAHAQASIRRRPLRASSRSTVSTSVPSGTGNTGSWGWPSSSWKLHRRAILERPDYAQAHYNLGNALYHVDRKQDAMQSYRTALQYEPDNVDALYNYALVANELNRNDLVPPHIQTLKALNPALATELERELQ